MLGGSALILTLITNLGELLEALHLASSTDAGPVIIEGRHVQCKVPIESVPDLHRNGVGPEPLKLSGDPRLARVLHLWRSLSVTTLLSLLAFTRICWSIRLVVI